MIVRFRKNDRATRAVGGLPEANARFPKLGFSREHTTLPTSTSTGGNPNNPSVAYFVNNIECEQNSHICANVAFHMSTTDAL